jgi:hypothetical protein
MHGEHPYGLLAKSKTGYIRRLGTTTEEVFISNQYQTCSSQEELPEITAQDVVYGGVKPQGHLRPLHGSPHYRLPVVTSVSTRKHWRSGTPRPCS